MRRRIHLPYSDSVDPAEVACYGYEEIFAEKIRALGERLRPRDLYDVIHIYRREDLRPAPASVRKILEEKCRYKNVPFPTLEDLNREPRRSELETEWENMLGHQLPILPPFRQFWDEVPEVFAWMLEQRAPALLPSIAGEEGESRPATFPVPPPTHIPLIRGGLSRPAPQPARQFVKPARVLEVIQFAGANRLCVLLGYNGTKRLIEPYALRTTKEGNYLLHTVRTDSGEHRAYRVDKIEGAELTQRPFIPRYTIELTATGPLYAPPQGRVSSSTSSIMGRSTKSTRRTRVGSSGQKYIFRCPACGRKFTRKKYDATLNEHNDKNGNPCFGRYGVHEGTEWG